jgi:hypothetical protein
MAASIMLLITMAVRVAVPAVIQGMVVPVLLLVIPAPVRVAAPPGVTEALLIPAVAVAAA